MGVQLRRERILRIRLKYGINACNLLSGKPVSIIAARPVPPNAARYHCDTAAKQCIVAAAGHSTVGSCLTACASAVPPDTARYHCDTASRTCTVAASGHSNVTGCLTACQPPEVV